MRTSLIFLALAIGCGAAEEPAPANPEPAEPVAVDPGPAPEPSPEANPHTDWYACIAASDCVLVPATCGGSTGANVTHAADVTAEQEALRAVSLCAPSTVPPVPMHPDCVSSVCVAAPDELPTTS